MFAVIGLIVSMVFFGPNLMMYLELIIVSLHVLPHVSFLCLKWENLQNCSLCAIVH